MINKLDTGHYLQLAAGDLLRLETACGTTVRVTRGLVWLTQERDKADVVLREGDSFTIERDGLTLAQAQAASELRVVESPGSLVSIVERAAARPGGGRARLSRVDWRSRLGSLMAFS